MTFVYQYGAAVPSHEASQVERARDAVRGEQLRKALDAQVEQAGDPPYRDVAFVDGKADHFHESLGFRRRRTHNRAIGIGGIAGMGSMTRTETGSDTHAARWLARCQPSQWYVLVDVGAFGAQDLPAENWVSALVELENSASYPDLLRALREVFARYREPEAQGFKEALYKWAQHSPLTLQGELLPSYRELEGGEMATLQEARAREWQARWFRRGHEQGIEQGQVEGRRAMLRRQAAREFDAETAGRLCGVLNGLADPERLAEIGEWIIECETGAELLDRAKQMSRRG